MRFSLRAIVIIGLSCLVLINPVSASICGHQKAGVSVVMKNGKKIRIDIPPEKLESTPKWISVDSELPLGINKASEIGLTWARNKYNEYDDLRIVLISLSGFDCWGRNGYWYYKITFAPIKNGREYRTASEYMVVVLMDGSIIEPISE